MPANRHICVYCASSDQVDRTFFDTATQMGAELAQRGCTLVYGGGGLGLMGALAKAVRAGGGRVVGVIPEALTDAEAAWEGCDELIVTPDMRSRKGEMDKRCDAFVALPGGLGTLEELFETLTHRQLGYHDKPIVIVNAHGFYNPLLDLFEHMYEHRFARAKARGLYRVVNEVSEVFDALEESTPVTPPSSRT